VKGVISDGEEIEGPEGLEEWAIGEDEDSKSVLASAADITKCEDGDRTIWIGTGAEGGEEGEEGEEDGTRTACRSSSASEPS